MVLDGDRASAQKFSKKGVDYLWALVSLLLEKKKRRWGVGWAGEAGGEEGCGLETGLVGCERRDSEEEW